MRPRRLLNLAAIAGAYLVTARLGLSLDAVAGFATLVWPPTGIAIAALLLGGAGLWPAITAGALAANLLAGAPAVAACAIAIGNTLEAVIAARLLRRWDFDRRLGRPRDVLLLAGIAAVVAPAVSASVGVASLAASGALGGVAAATAWRAWWVGDALGALLVAPAILLAWMRPPPGTWRRLPEAMLLLGAVVASCLVVFFDVFGWDFDLLRQEYLVFPLLVWAALRLRMHGAGAALLVTAALAVAGTASGHGPFIRDTLAGSLLLLQSYLAFLAIGVWLLAAAVTDRDRALAEAHAARREAEDAVRAREDFLSIASHDLRTPLTSLRLRVHAMMRAPSPPDGVESLSRQVDRLAALIDGLLDVSRARAGRLDIRPEPLDLRALADEVAARSQDEVQRSGGSLQVTGDPSCPGTWDRLRLEQVLSNLVGNAIRHAPGAAIHVEVRALPERALVQVRDLGDGIAAADRERIFERFAQGSGSDPRGLGLGLWIVAEVLRAMGGTIHLSSSPGEGAAFVVEIPRVDPGEAGSTPR